MPQKSLQQDLACPTFNHPNQQAASHTLQIQENVSNFTTLADLFMCEMSGAEMPVVTIK